MTLLIVTNFGIASSELSCSNNISTYRLKGCPSAKPLQIIQYLGRGFEEAYQIGQKPVTAEMIEGVLAQDINGLESTLTRNGYGLKVVAELVNVRPTEIRSFLQGRLSASRAQELRDEMLAVGIPL